MNDLDLEERIRTTLGAVADATPMGGGSTVRRSSRGPWFVAAACLVLVAGAAGLALRASGETEQPATSPAPRPSTGDVLPDGYDADTAAPVFAAAGSPEDVVAAYLRSRFPDFPAPGVRVTTPRVAGDSAVARWTTEDSSGVIAEGTVLLRTVGARWSVVAATSTDVDLKDLAFDGSRLVGTVRSTDDDLLAVDVLDPDGAPLASDPKRGSDEGSHVFGTAGEGHDAVEVDVAASGPVVVQVRLVGGTVLAVAELRLDPPATAIAQLAAGSGAEPAWELVATDETTGHWVTLRAPGMTGTFRIQVDEPVTVPFVQLGPCCELGDHVLVAGALHPDATGLQVVLSNGAAIAGEAVDDPGRGVTYAVVAVPRSSIPLDATARVHVRLGEELVDSGLELELLPIGG